MATRKKGVLADLELEEFSLVTGPDRRPANQGAVALFYKSAPADSGSGGDAGATPNAGGGDASRTGDSAMKKKTTLAGRIGSAVAGVLEKAGITIPDEDEDVEKATRVVEHQSNSTHQHNDVMTETVMPEGQMVQASTEKSEEGDEEESLTPKKTTTATVIQVTEEGFAKALAEALNPFAKAVGSINTRLTAIEKQSSGSRRLKSAPYIEVGSEGGDAVKYASVHKQLLSQFRLTPGQKLTKAAITSGNFTVGLKDDEAQQFLDYVVDESVLLKLVRREPMDGPTKTINAIGLGQRVLRKGTAATPIAGAAQVTVATNVQISLATSEVIGEVFMSDDSLEDNIEGDALVTKLLGIVGRSMANELELALLHGDTGVADANGINDRWDGWDKIARAGGAHVIDGFLDGTPDGSDRGWAGVNGIKGSRLIRALPTKYAQDLAALKFIMHPHAYMNFVDTLTGITSGQAFDAITGARPLPLRSVDQVRVPLLSTNIEFDADDGGGVDTYTDGTFVMLTDPRNLILGVQRDIRIETERSARDRGTYYVFSARLANQVEQADAIAIYDHLAVQV